MKKTIKLLAVVMVVAMLALALVSCAKTLNGKYTSESGLGDLAGSRTVYEFTGNKVTMTVTTSTILTGESTTIKTGTYEIMEDNDDPSKLVIAFEFEGEDRYTRSFSEGENVDGEKIITIGGIDYKQTK